MATLIFFSLSPSKRGVYIVAIYAPLSLLVGAGAARMVARGGGYRSVTAALVASALALAGILALLPYAARRERDLVELFEPGLLSAIGVAMSVATAGLVVAAVLAARRRLRWALYVAVGAMASTWLLLAIWVLPKLEPVKSARPLATTFARIAAPDQPYGLYGRPLHAAFVFYAGRYGVHLQGRDQLDAWLHEPGRRWLVVRRDQLEALGGDVPGMVELISERDPRRGWVLLTSRPAPPLAVGDVDAVALRPGAAPDTGAVGR
jgi:hypothetical protein